MSERATGRPRLTIVVVTYRSRGTIDACLRALAAPSSVAHETVVVDNASDDGTAAFVRSQFPDVRVVETGANLGFGRANNVAVRDTRSELVLFLNPDTVVRPGALDQLVAVLDATPGVAVAGPRIVDGRGQAELSFGTMISPLAELRQKLLVHGLERRWPVLAAAVERRTHRPAMVDWVSGACLLIRREDLERAGLFDERYFLYTEDVDLCATVRRHGRLVRFSPEAVVEHRRGASRASAPGPTEEAYRRSQIAFYRKHHPRWAPWLALYLKVRGRLPDRSKQDP